MWRQVANIDDALEMLNIMELTDPVVYTFSLIKGYTEFESQLIVTELADPNHAYWIYDDGTGKAALHLSKRLDPDAGMIAKIETYCAYNFDPDLFTNWEIGYKVLTTKCRELVDAWGLKVSHGAIPRTRNGECLAYFADSIVWEKSELELNYNQRSYKIKFDRDPNLKPVDETLYEPVNVSDIDPDAKPIK